MTSTYDMLGKLLYQIKNSPEIASLVSRVCEYAIDEISKVNPKILNWEDWSKKGIHKAKFLGGTLNQVASFFSDAHTLLDHVEKYHLETINDKLNLIISKLYNWFCCYKDRESYDRYHGLLDFKPATIRRYPKIFKELKRMMDEGIIDTSWIDKRRKKKIEKWLKVIDE